MKIDPNAVGIEFFRQNIGKKIEITTPDGWGLAGNLLQFDSYNILMLVAGKPVLVKQAPGMIFHTANGG